MTNTTKYHHQIHIPMVSVVFVFGVQVFICVVVRLMQGCMFVVVTHSYSVVVK